MSIFKTQLFLYGNFDFLLIRKIEKERNTQTPKLKNENKKRYKRHRIIHDRSKCKGWGQKVVHRV